MNGTLAERLREAMNDAEKRVTQAALAKACGVKPPSVSDWLSGKTKSIEGVNLVRAAAFLNVRPRWLGEGVGPKRPDNVYAPREVTMVAEPLPPASTTRTNARHVLETMPERVLPELIRYMQWLLERERGNSPPNSAAGGR